MAPDPATPVGDDEQSRTVMSRVLGAMSVFTMLMTVPQVLTIWVGHQAAGVSIVSWSAYLLSARLRARRGEGARKGPTVIDTTAEREGEGKK